MAKRSVDTWRAEHGEVQFAPGVTIIHSLYGYDHFRGSAEALVACGMISDDRLPGRPSRGKVRCTYHPNGEKKGNSGAHSSLVAGVMVVTRMGSNRFEIQRRVSDEECARRRELLDARDAQIEREHLMARHTQGELRASLHLVSSGPTKRAGPPGWRVITNPHPPGYLTHSL